MTIKVIVTDMDGTFLDDAKKYDRARFMAQYLELKKRNIEFPFSRSSKTKYRLSLRTGLCSLNMSNS